MAARKSVVARPVAQYDIKTGELLKVFESIKDAADTIPGKHTTTSTNICKVCRGIAYTAYGYKWAYYEEKK